MGGTAVLLLLASVDDRDLAVLARLGADRLRTFSSTEIAMTVIVGLASTVGIIRALFMKGDVRGWSATAIILLAAVLQATAIRLSLLPSIAHR